jgi:PAS domain S-box-containing protein
VGLGVMKLNPDEKEINYREIVDILPAAVFETDLKGQIVFINHAGCDILGYSSEEMLGKPFLQFIAAEDQSRCLQTSNNVLAGKFLGDNEFIILKKDGTRISAFIKSAPCKNSSGELIGLRGVVIDISGRKSIEAALRKSEQKYRSLINNIELGVFRGTLEGGGSYLEVNKAMEDILGYTREELLSMEPVSHFVNPEDRKEFLEKIVDSRETVRMESKFRKKDGSEIWLAGSSTPVRDAEGKILYVDTIMEDVTERRKTEEKNKQLASIVEFSQDAIYSMTLDETVTSWNIGAETIFGYKAAEIIGQTVTVIIPPDRLYEKDFINMKLRRLESVDGFETTAIKKGGQKINISLTICPITDQYNQLIGVSNICRDITEHTRAQEVLRDSEEKYRSLVNNLKVGVFRSTPDSSGKMLELNRAMEEITGYAREELFSIKTRDLFANQEESLDLMEEAKKKNNALSRELLWVRKDGVFIMVAITVNPIKNNNGEIIWLDSIIEDITVRKMAEEERKLADEKVRMLYKIEKAQREELQEESNARGLFISALAHELRTPLTPILNSTELLKEIIIASQSDSIPAKLINNVVESSQNLARRLEELLDLGAASRGIFKLHVQPVRLRPLFEKVIKTCRPVFIRHQQRLIAEIPDDIPEAVIDPVRIEQVISNLLSNASKFSPDKSQIALIVKVEESVIQVDVRDQGIGISPRDQEKLFKPYHRVEQDRQIYPGAGLGLAVCKEIIQAHHGKIWITSDTGTGSVFSFKIPIKQTKSE